jgi:hypothetical protein
MAQKALGRALNWTPAGDGVWINVREAGGIGFGCYLGGAAGDTYTLQEAKDSAGTGAQNLAAISEYFTNTGNASDAWTRRTQAAAATVVTTATAAQQAAWFEVENTQLSDTYKYVKVTSTGAGTVAPVARDLMTQRAADKLPAMGA